MSQCKTHPYREAVAQCSRCSNPMCEICVGNTTGPLLCTTCLSTPRPQQQDSFWVESTPYTRDEGKVGRYLLYGAIGGILWAIGVSMATFVNLFYFLNPIEIFYVWMNYTSFGIFAISTIAPIGEQFCRYVLYVNIIGILFTFTYDLMFGFFFFLGYTYYLVIVFGINFLLFLVPAIGLWRIRASSQSSSLASFLTFLMLLYYPATFLLTVMGSFTLFVYILPQVTLILIAILTTVFFVKERSGISQVHSTW
ncbi:MAG: hypothetical protein ACXAEF_14165 [Candidatus Thorarchaeota archaeon]